MKKSYLIIILLALSFRVLAQWSTDPAVNNAISDLSGEQVIPKIAICPNGNIYVAFLSNQTGFYNVRLQKLDSQGNELWAHNGILISDNPTDSWVTDWDMTADVNNHAVIAYNDTRNGNMNVYGYRISPDGTFVWGANGIALSNNTAFNAAPKVTTTASGNAIFAWTSDDVIIMQRVNAAGAKQWGDNGITLSSTNSLSWPQLLPVGTDDFIMKYFDDEGSPPYPTRHVYAQRYNSSGTAVWSAPAVISEAGGISSWTQIFPFVNDGSDGFLLHGMMTVITINVLLYLCSTSALPGKSYSQLMALKLQQQVAITIITLILPCLPVHLTYMFTGMKWMQTRTTMASMDKRYHRAVTVCGVMGG